MADGDGITDVVDASGNGQGVALNVNAPQPFINDTMLVTDPNAPYRVRSLVGLDTALAGASSAGLKPIASRTLLAAETIGINLIRYLYESGRDGPFKFMSAAQFLTEIGTALPTVVAADTQKALVVAPTSDPTGASGAWVRKFNGPINVQWFGALNGASAAINGPAFLAAIATLNSMSVSGFAYGKGTRTLYIPWGVYDLGNTTLDLTFTMIIEGETSAENGGLSSVLKWNAGHSGFRVQRFDTTGDSGTGGTAAQGGDASIIRRLGLIGGFTTTEGEFHAIHARARVTVEDVFCDSWQGDALRIDTSVSGNANLTMVTRLSAQNCRNTIFTKGGDSNAGYFEAVSGIANRQANINENSFLGNSYQMPHGAACARTSYNTGVGIPTSFVHRTGNIYFAIPGQEAWCSTNAPSGAATNNQGWIWFGAGGISASSGVPDWFNGISVRAGGAIVSTGLSNASTFTAPYGEIDCCSIFDQRSLILNPQGDAVRVMCSGGGVGKLRMFVANSNGVEVSSDFRVKGDFFAGSISNFLGPISGASVVDGVTTFASRSTSHTFSFNVYDAAGAATTNIGLWTWGSGFGNSCDLTSSAAFHRWKVGGTQRFLVDSSGATVGGALVASGTVTGSNLSGTNTGDQTTITGNAGTATKLATARAIGITGGGITATGVNFDGSAAINMNASVDAGHITLARMANLAANSIIGNNTGGAAVPLALTSAQVTAFLAAAVSGGAQGAMSGQDKARLDASFTRYHSLLDCSGWLTAADAAGTYGMGQGDKCAISGTGTQYPLNTIYIAAADYPAAGTLAAKLRIRVQIHCNDVAPGVTFTAALHPVTRPATSGAAGLCIYTIGAAVASSGIAIATPAADSSNVAVGAADIALPADGYYVIGITTSGGALAASSHVHISAILQMRYA